jgi:hypothetical protein
VIAQTDGSKDIKSRAVTGESSVEPSRWLASDPDRSSSDVYGLDYDSSLSANMSTSDQTSTMLGGSFAAPRLREEAMESIHHAAAGTNAVHSGDEASTDPTILGDPTHTEAAVVSRPPKVHRASYSLEHHNPLRDSIYSIQSEGMSK